MRALAAIALLLAGCDFYSGHPERGDAAPGRDAAVDSCGLWTLEASTARAIALMDQPPYETGRSTRVAVTTALAECEERAMPAVALDVGRLTATIQLAVWRQIEGTCAPAEGTVVRPVVLELPDPGTWTITAEGAAPLSVKIEAGAGGQCGTGGGECRRDCDCDPGQVCLRGTGVGGPFSACVRACEVDRDCGGSGVCADIADGLSRMCTGGDECNEDGDPACPTGYACDLDTDSCQPGFTLGQEARGPCACDRDCQDGLRCVRGRPDEEAHCEVLCPTGGPWCEGAHACGTAAEDAAGLATTDSVCVWSGE